MKIIFRPFVGEHDWGWFQQYESFLKIEDLTGVMAIDVEKNETVAGVLFDSWTPNSCQAHIVITNPMVLRHGFLEECFNFAFNTAGRKLMIGLVKSDNMKARKLDEHMGFKKAHVIKDGFSDGVDFIVYEMRKEDCRFIKQEEG